MDTREKEMGHGLHGRHGDILQSPFFRVVREIRVPNIRHAILSFRLLSLRLHFGLGQYASALIASAN
jgi:hypothetical protein